MAALVSPSALSLIAIAFPSGRERATAMGVFSAVSMAGSAIGLVLGGILTQYAEWCWCLRATAAMAVPAIIMTVLEVPEQRTRRRNLADRKSVV